MLKQQKWYAHKRCNILFTYGENSSSKSVGVLDSLISQLVKLAVAVNNESC